MNISGNDHFSFISHNLWQTYVPFAYFCELRRLLKITYYYRDAFKINSTKNEKKTKNMERSIPGKRNCRANCFCFGFGQKKKERHDFIWRMEHTMTTTTTTATTASLACSCSLHKAVIHYIGFLVMSDINNTIIS